MSLWASKFFFSSTRRHTRWPRDWSSDVCSSDLGSIFVSVRELPATDSIVLEVADTGIGIPEHYRSEERRVGKECRSWWTQDNQKHKHEEQYAPALRHAA